ncbi:uncharacterized protein LOC135492214 [Lineus longissimus]|uniref:uncharacterized protein LOC135492214 n=1 Tax=Lineus longissimus TaxID=88925 RepID=UPI002B4F7297
MFRSTKIVGQNVLRFCKHLPQNKHFSRVSSGLKHVKTLLVPSGLLLCAQPLTPTDDFKGNVFSKPCLTHKSLIQNATALTVDAVSSLLNQTVIALIDTEKEYQQALTSLIALTEYSLTVLDNERLQDQVWERMIEVRGVVNEKKKEKGDLNMIFDYTEKLMITAAETAFISGSEYTCTTASERLLSAKSQLEKIRKATDEVEAKLKEVEVKSIHVISQHSEEDQGEPKEKKAKTVTLES